RSAAASAFGRRLTVRAISRITSLLRSEREGGVVLNVLKRGTATLFAAVLRGGVSAFAQSPNNSGVVVIVTDQAGLVVKDARVSMTNNQTGAIREAASGADGSASFPALSLTGTYTVLVTKQGFGDETRDNIRLRSGEVATLRVKLLVGAEKSEVTVIGTEQGVR